MTHHDSTQLPSSLRRVRTVRRYMAAGLLMSFFGTSIVGGVVPGIVAVGAVSVLWLPVIQTVETLEDLMSPAAAMLLRGRDPGRVLLGCETFDAALCATALVAIGFTNVDAHIVLISYMLVASVVPLFIDIAEELFAGNLAKISSKETLQFNITIYAAIGFVGSLVARPLGSIVSDIALQAALYINLVVSLTAVLLRTMAVRTLPALGGRKDVAATDGREGPDAAHHPRHDSWRKLVTSKGPGSPMVSGALACSNAIVVMYVAQWAARPMPNPALAMAAILVATGLGMTAGPYLSRRSTDSLVAAARGFLIIRLAMYAGILAAAIFLQSAEDIRFALILPAMFGLGASTSGSTVIQATARQVRYADHELARIVGWSHSAAAGGTLVGAWCGLLLGVQRSPAMGVVAASIAAMAAFRSIGKLRDSG